MKKFKSMPLNQTEFNINIDSDTDKKNKILVNIIRDHISPPQNPLTIKTIQQFIYNWTKLQVKRREIKDILKESLNYSYKKGSSGSKKLLWTDNKIQKSIFAWRIFMNILDNKLIINIDETSF